MLADEVRRLSVDVEEVGETAVHAAGPLRDGYRLCLWSRVASRVLLPLAEVDAEDDSALYDELSKVAWWEHFDASKTFAIGNSQTVKSSFPAHFWVQRAKDAIVDAFRAEIGERPSVRKDDPDVPLHLHLGEQRHSLSLDFSGALHRRGYRKEGGQAPIKENLAAAILYLAGWPKAAREGLPLVDPTCGAGTFLIEAAWMATNRAPGLSRERFGFERWLGHDAALFEAEREAAFAELQAEAPSAIVGSDASREVLEKAQQNLRAAGVERLVTLREEEVSNAVKPAAKGVLVCNPPHGHRLGDQATLFLFYQALGDTLKRGFDGWTAYVFAAHGGSLKHLGLRPTSRHVLYNGAVECRLLEIPVRGKASDSETAAPAWRKPSDKASMFANRMRKNAKKWRRWAKREGLDAYRLYDADIPEYDVAVDQYPGKVVVHVFQKEQEVRDGRVQQKLQDVLLTLPDALGVAPTDVVVKVRRKHDQGDQYARVSEEAGERVVHEGELRFVVNLEERIDTGLFLDHRLVRRYAHERCDGKRVLNLFAYTCSVSVAAAAGGARVTTSVDLSNTYLEWGRDNFRQNGLDPDAHRFVRRDAMRFIAKDRGVYDWAFINPPTFSRSKMGTFNIHKDHGTLLGDAMARLARGGELLFTTHARRFELGAAISGRFEVRDLTRTLVPADFVRYPFRAFALTKD